MRCRERLVQRAQAEAERRLESAIDERRALEAVRGDVRAAHAELLDAVARLDARWASGGVTHGRGHSTCVDCDPRTRIRRVINRNWAPVRKRALSRLDA